MGTTRRSSPVGGLLKQWRGLRRKSQMELALDAGISPRHLSFLETGRSRPSREMVLLLSEVLAVPLGERNALLEAAGYARMYRQTPLSAHEMQQVRKVLGFILERHEPYGAVAVDGNWDILMANRPYQASIAQLLDLKSLGSTASNLMRLTFHPSGLRQYIVNWDEVGATLLGRLRREIAADPAHEQLAALAEELEALAGPSADWHVPTLESPPAILVPLRIRKGELALNLFSTITTLGAPQDITLQGLRIESFFPDDEETDALIRSTSAGGEAGLCEKDRSRTGSSAKRPYRATRMMDGGHPLDVVADPADRASL